MNCKPSAAFAATLMASAGVLSSSLPAGAAAPPIRLASDNQVPACATPARLDAFLDAEVRARGFDVVPRHRNIAKWYQHHGERQRVRWDYAFFQMALETNFLTFRRSNGKRGDVLPRQNNFAGLGTTGGGVRGDSYPDVSTGVLAQIQHLVVYSGQRLARPTGHRTRLKQDVILRSIGKIVRKRPVTFADLAGRWAADKRYGRSLQRLAARFYRRYCSAGWDSKASAVSPVQSARPVRRASATGSPAVIRRDPAPVTTRAGGKKGGVAVRNVLQVARPPQAKSASAPVGRPAAVVRPSAQPAPSRAAKIAGAGSTAAKAPSCRIQIAGAGRRTVLIRSKTGSITHLTALSVYPGFEQMMAERFIQSYAPAGQTLGAFDSRQAAVAEAQALCGREMAQAGR